MMESEIVHHLFKRQFLGSSSEFQLKLFKNRLSIAKNLYKRDLVSHFGCVNAIEFSQDGKYLTSGRFIFLLIMHAFLRHSPDDQSHTVQ